MDGGAAHKTLHAVLVMAALFLGGCVAPVTQAAISSATLITTGKGPSDHVLSAVSGQDCEVHRYLEDEAICQYNPYGLSSATWAARTDDPSGSAVSGIYRTSARSLPAPGGPTATDEYFVVGTFEAPADAYHIGRSLLGLPTAISVTDHGPSSPVRLVAGPIGGRETWFSRQLAAAGVTDAWPIALCRDDLRPPPCVVTPPPPAGTQGILVAQSR